MKSHEFIQAAIDMLSPTSSPEPEGEHIIGGADIVIQNRPDEHEVEADHEDHTDKSKMIAPLQQKLELLKRAVGVDNVYDNEADELDQILKIAGVPTASIFDAGDDEPLDS